MGFFTGLGYWTRVILKCVYLQQKETKKNTQRCCTIGSVRKTQRHSEKPLIHKDIERLVDVLTLNFLLDKNLMKIGTIGEMKYGLDFSVTL